MNEELPKFDLWSVCAKCGNAPDRHPWAFVDPADVEYRSPTPGDEYLLRTCRRCGYTWKESCVEGTDG